DVCSSDAVASLGWGVIEALLNGETWFRRDRATFEVLERELLPALTAARGGPVRILSAGSGSGQEAYSLAIAALEAGARVEVLATDLSRQAIEQARAEVRRVGEECGRGGVLR